MTETIPEMLPALGWAPDMPPSPDETNSIPRASVCPGAKRLRAAFITVMVVPWTMPCGADVHVRPGGHLPVLRDPQGVHALPVIGFRVVGDHHAVGHHNARRPRMRREQTQRMTRIHDQRLPVGHLGEVFHRQPVLRPVLEHGTVSAVGDQFVGEGAAPRAGRGCSGSSA